MSARRDSCRCEKHAQSLSALVFYQLDAHLRSLLSQRRITPALDLVVTVEIGLSMADKVERVCHKNFLP